MWVFSVVFGPTLADHERVLGSGWARDLHFAALVILKCEMVLRFCSQLMWIWVSGGFECGTFGWRGMCPTQRG